MFKLVRLSNVVSRRVLFGKQVNARFFERRIGFTKNSSLVNNSSHILSTTSIYKSSARFCSTSATQNYTELEKQAEEIWKSAKNLDQAIDLQHQAYKACDDPSVKLDLFLKYVDMLVHTGNVDKALTITQDALTKYPDHAHEFHMRRGLIYESMNNLHAARDEYQRLLETNPSHYTALRSLAYTYCQEAETMSPDQRALFAQTAIDLFTKSREVTPDEQDAAHIDTLYGRATAYRMIKKYTKAAEDLAHVVELDRDYAPAYLMLGDMLQIEGKYKNAIIMYDKFFDAFPIYYKNVSSREMAISSNHLLAYMLMQRGICYMHIKDYTMATEVFNNLLSLPGFQDHDVAHLMLGKSLIQEGKWALAEKAFSRALELNAGLLDGYHERAEAYEHMGKFEEAKKDREMLAMLQREKQGESKTVK